MASIGIIIEEEYLFHEIISWFKKLFVILQPCRDVSDIFKHKPRYPIFENTMISLMVNSTFRMYQESAYWRSPNAVCHSYGWSLDIKRIEFAKIYQRRGFGLRLFQWLHENTPTDIIFVERVTTMALNDFLIKNQNILYAIRCNNSPTDWIIKKINLSA